MYCKQDIKQTDYKRFWDGTRTQVIDIVHQFSTNWAYWTISRMLLLNWIICRYYICRRKCKIFNYQLYLYIILRMMCYFRLVLATQLAFMKIFHFYHRYSLAIIKNWVRPVEWLLIWIAINIQHSCATPIPMVKSQFGKFPSIGYILF